MLREFLTDKGSKLLTVIRHDESGNRHLVTLTDLPKPASWRLVQKLEKYNQAVVSGDRAPEQVQELFAKLPRTVRNFISFING